MRVLGGKEHKSFIHSLCWFASGLHFCEVPKVSEVLSMDFPYHSSANIAVEQDHHLMVVCLHLYMATASTCRDRVVRAVKLNMSHVRDLAAIWQTISLKGRQFSGERIILATASSGLGAWPRIENHSELNTVVAAVIVDESDGLEHQYHEVQHNCIMAERDFLLR